MHEAEAALSRCDVEPFLCCYVNLCCTPAKQCSGVLMSGYTSVTSLKPVSTVGVNGSTRVIQATAETLDVAGSETGRPKKRTS